MRFCRLGIVVCGGVILGPLLDDVGDIVADEDGELVYLCPCRSVPERRSRLGPRGLHPVEPSVCLYAQAGRQI